MEVVTVYSNAFLAQYLYGKQWSALPKMVTPQKINIFG